MSEVIERVRQGFIFRDDFCNAKVKKKNLVCEKGTLTFTGDISQDFRLYRAWCNGCGKIKVLDEKDFVTEFKRFIKRVEKEVEA